MNAPKTKDPLAPPAKADAKAENKKVPKAKKDGEVTPKRSKFAALYPDASKIELLVTDNPKKEGSKARVRFQHYFDSATVQDYLAAGGTYADIAYDVGHKFISVTVPAE